MSDKIELLPCPFCGGECDPRGWASWRREAGPECCDCGATAGSVLEWNRRAAAAQQPAPAAPAAVGQEPVAWGAYVNGDLITGSQAYVQRERDEYEATCIDDPDFVHEVALPLYTAPPAAEQPYSTTSDKYRAELYDEVWEKARGMGYGNVTMALAELERMKIAEQAACVSDFSESETQDNLSEERETQTAEQPDTVKVSRELLERMANDIAYAVYNLADKKLAGLRRGLVETTDPADTALIVERELRALLAGGDKA